MDSLIIDIQNTESGNFHGCSGIRYEDWNSEKVNKKYGVWGPPAKQYSFPEIAYNKSADWLKERVIAVAELFLGYDYQHHHIPVWESAPDRNWKVT